MGESCEGGIGVGSEVQKSKKMQHCYSGSQCYKDFREKCYLYREDSSLFRLNFVQSFSEGQNIIQKGENLRDIEKI